MNYAALIGIQEKAIATKGFNISGAMGKAQFYGVFFFLRVGEEEKAREKNTHHLSLKCDHLIFLHMALQK